VMCDTLMESFKELVEAYGCEVKIEHTKVRPTNNSQLIAAYSRHYAELGALLATLTNTRIENDVTKLPTTK
jgi:hypothetical protein